MWNSEFFVDFFHFAFRNLEAGLPAASHAFRVMFLQHNHPVLGES